MAKTIRAVTVSFVKPSETPQLVEVKRPKGKTWRFQGLTTVGDAVNGIALVASFDRKEEPVPPPPALEDGNDDDEEDGEGDDGIE